MGQIKPYLPVICSMVLACMLFAFDATAYHNAANEIDYAKAVGAFGVLYASFTAFFKMNPPEESK